MHTEECKKSIKKIHVMDAKIRALWGNSGKFGDVFSDVMYGKNLTLADDVL